MSDNKYTYKQFNRIGFVLDPFAIDLDFDLRENRIDIQITQFEKNSYPLNWYGHVPFEIAEFERQREISFSGINDQIQYEKYTAYWIKVLHNKVELKDSGMYFPVDLDILAHYIESKADKFCHENQELFTY